MPKQEDLIIYGTKTCADCIRVKQLLDERSVKYAFKDIDADDEVRAHMESLTDGGKTVPVITMGKRMIVEPSNQDLLSFLGLPNEATQKLRDVVMVGAGPAALTAAVYTTREDIDTVLLEKGVIGGLAAITDWVDNYPGFPEGISGLDLSENLRKQAERFGAVIELAEVTKITDQGSYKLVETTDGPIQARAVLIATGSDYKKIGVPGEKEYYGRGVHYCATCDGAFYRDKRLVVVGGGNSAVQEAMFLTRFASHIDILVRGPSLRASEVLQHELDHHKDKITVHFNTTTEEIVAQDNKVVKVIGKDAQSGEVREYPTDGVFVFVGLQPNTAFLKDSTIELDDLGLIKTDNQLQTSIPGVYCAGDVRSGATMQIASAVGEGATAALHMREYIDKQKKAERQAAA